LEKARDTDSSRSCFLLFLHHLSLLKARQSIGACSNLNLAMLAWTRTEEYPAPQCCSVQYVQYLKMLPARLSLDTRPSWKRFTRKYVLAFERRFELRKAALRVKESHYSRDDGIPLRSELEIKKGPLAPISEFGTRCKQRSKQSQKARESSMQYEKENPQLRKLETRIRATLTDCSARAEDEHSEINRASDALSGN